MFLLHKNPARAQSFDLAFGRVHVSYPEASAERCAAALLLDVDSVGLVRGKHGPEGEGGLLQQYVNDRPYIASSFLSVAIARMFGSALKGESKERPDPCGGPDAARFRAVIRDAGFEPGGRIRGATTVTVSRFLILEGSTSYGPTTGTGVG